MRNMPETFDARQGMHFLMALFKWIFENWGEKRLSILYKKEMLKFYDGMKNKNIRLSLAPVIYS